MEKVQYLSFQDIIDLLREKHGDGYYRFILRDERLTGVRIYKKDETEEDFVNTK